METIGPYEILEELGRGGMGVVYRAKGSDGKPVALKLLLPGREASPRAHARFAGELEALARLRHPGIVPFLACGEHEGAPWVALEYVEGESLADRLRRGPLTPEETIRIGQQLAQALQHVHGEGLLHRDLKPDNVLLRGEQALLTDFGLALDTSGDLQRLTQTGFHVGTPGFWAPEQGRGEKHAHGIWTDVYGLGAVLYACLTGFPPVRGKTLQACMASAMFEGITPPSEERPETPPWLGAVIMRCLAFDPDARPRSVAVVGRSLDQAKDLAAPPVNQLARVAAVVGTLTVLSVVLALVVVFGRNTGAPDPPPLETPVDSSATDGHTLQDPGLPLCFSLKGLPDSVLDGSLALYEPWCFKPEASGLRMIAQRPARPELVVPLMTRGESWELRASFSRVQLVTTGFVTACLTSFPVPESEGPEVEWRAVGWLLNLDSNYELQVRPITDVHDKSETRLELGVDPRSPLTLALRWEEPTLSLAIATPDGVVVRHEETLPPEVVPRGLAALRLGQPRLASRPSLGTAQGSWSSGRAAFTLTELTLWGQGLTLDPDRLLERYYEEGQLGWWYASETDPEGLRTAIAALKRESLNRPRAARMLPYLLAWLNAREGDVEEAVRQIQGVTALVQGYYPDPQDWTGAFHWTRNRLHADFALYPPALRAQLSRVVPELRPVKEALEAALNPPQEVDPAHFDDWYHARQWAWLEVGVHLTARDLPPDLPVDLVQALYESGLHQAAEAALRSAGPPADTREALWRGWLAFHQNRYRDALELWALADRSYPALEKAQACARRWAKPR